MQTLEQGSAKVQKLLTSGLLDLRTANWTRLAAATKASPLRSDVRCFENLNDVFVRCFTRSSMWSTDIDESSSLDLLQRSDSHLNILQALSQNVEEWSSEYERA